MKTVRCKFQLQEVTHFTGGGRKHVFRPQYDTSIEEDRRFARASPSGEFSIFIDNPAVFDYFKVGEFYYFDAIAIPPSDTPV